MLFAYCTSLHGGKLIESKAGKPGKLMIMMESWKARKVAKAGNIQVHLSSNLVCISARKIKRTSTSFFWYIIVFTCYPGKHKKLALVLQQQSTYLYLVIYIHRIDVAPSDDKEEEGTKI